MHWAHPAICLIIPRADVQKLTVGIPLPQCCIASLAGPASSQLLQAHFSVTVPPADPGSSPSHRSSLLTGLTLSPHLPPHSPRWTHSPRCRSCSPWACPRPRHSCFPSRRRLLPVGRGAGRAAAPRGWAWAGPRAQRRRQPQRPGLSSTSAPQRRGWTSSSGVNHIFVLHGGSLPQITASRVICRLPPAS